MMKKPPGRVIVEYKNTRRKGASHPNSIWGNLDLKSVARQIEDETLQGPDRHTVLDGDLDQLTGAVPPSPPLTSSEGQLTTTSLAPEGPMAEENEIVADLDDETAEVLPPGVEEPKKRRGSRKKVAAEATSDDGSARAGKPRAKRGRPKTTAARKTGNGAAEGEGALTTKEPATASSDAKPVVSASVDELEDLLQLEQENQRLRKLLAEKLREENATLRRRLGLD
jgi:hypothetical protein